ncbi:MAG: DegV family protein [Clostridiaceae bacterium]|nr:DegV family protein [Clostridiaceae bacterium]
MGKVILTSESACDLGAEHLTRLGVPVIPYHIYLDGGDYLDGVNLTADDIFRVYHEKHVLPQTGAVNVQDFVEFFTPFVEQGYEVVHIGLGSAISCSYQNAIIAAESLPGVYPVDSRNLSTGVGTLVIYAKAMIERGMSGAEVKAACEELRTRIHGSFVIDTLEFLAAGGRCSALAAFGANLLRLHPCIEVDTQTGKLAVGKKYRGQMTTVLPQYFHDFVSRFSDVETDFIFLTHAGSLEEEISLSREAIWKVHPYKEVYITRAGCTISTHCGPRCIGCFVVTKK